MLNALDGYKTYLGLLISLLSLVSAHFGYHLAPGFSESVTQTIDLVIQVGGLLFALYGRLVATVPGLLVKDAQ